MFIARRSYASLSSLLQRLVDVVLDVVHVLEADGQAHELGRQPALPLLLLGELGVGGAGRVQGEALRVSDVGQVGEAASGC